ncbi:hypothetical protein FGO68_gene4754 [Halteria grandinella]|uniref:Uncharacterized protein n=1 Tax=Halteria grandinella TaxID=5974 RepID=A0A8J8T4K3_HALGN|nr:hypothetical protein FGO68_gene4754 [Halteria grandinella]
MNNTYMVRYPINFSESVPSSVEILRFSVDFEWNPNWQDVDSRGVLKVKYLCVKIKKMVELKYLLKWIMPQVMIVIELPFFSDQSFFEQIVREKTFDGFSAEIVFSLDDQIEITALILKYFDKIQIQKKYLLGKKFSQKNIWKRYLESQKENLVELFNQNKNFEHFLRGQLNSFSAQWSSTDKQLKEIMKLPTPGKIIKVENYDALHPDFFFANVAPREITRLHINDATYNEFADGDLDLYTKQLVINL